MAIYAKALYYILNFKHQVLDSRNKGGLDLGGCNLVLAKPGNNNRFIVMIVWRVVSLAHMLFQSMSRLNILVRLPLDSRASAI
jgi:hypothetical protein